MTRRRLLLLIAAVGAGAVSIVPLLTQQVECLPIPTAEDLLDAGTTHAANGRLSRAIECLTACIALKPDMAAAYHLRGETRLQMCQYEEAISDLTTWRKRRDSNPRSTA